MCSNKHGAQNHAEFLADDVKTHQPMTEEEFVSIGLSLERPDGVLVVSRELLAVGVCQTPYQIVIPLAANE